MRMNFRDYFLYSISGKTGDPIKEGTCNPDCLTRTDLCCVNVTAKDLKTGLIVIDKLCMIKSIANA